MTTIALRLVSALVVAGCLSAALAADTGLNVASSSIIATFKQENVPVDAPFKAFSGTIKYDPANPDGASAAITVDMTSLDIGDEGYNAEIRKPAWFDSARYPLGTFISASLKAGPSGHFEATGTLTIKGKAASVTVPIVYHQVGATNSFDGAFDISRKAFGIGDPSWDDVLDDKVHVRFHLVKAGS